MRLQYDIAIIGAENVRRTLGSMERQFMAHNARVRRRAGVKAGPQKSPEAEVLRVHRLEQGLQRFQHKQAMRNIATERRAKIQAERDRAKAATSLDRQRSRALYQQFREQEREKLRRARLAERQMLATSRARERFTRGALGTVTGSVRGTTRMLAGGAVAALGLGGGMLTANAVRKFAGAEKSAAVLANKAYGVNGETRSRAELKNSILSQARSVGMATGIGTEGSVEALRQYHAKSGMMPEGQRLLPFMADIADAYGADVGDVGRTAGQISQALAVGRGMKGEELVKNTTEIMAAMAGQAKIGSIEFADLARNMGALISSTSRFDGQVSDLANTMGAFGQMAIAGGASSPEEAMTALRRLSDDMVKHQKTFRQQGIEVFADKGRTRLRDPAEVFFDILKKTKGDLSKTSALFGIRSSKAFEPFQKAFTEAGGGEKGVAAMRANLTKFKSAKVTPAELQQAAAAVRETSSKRFDRAMAKMEDAIGKTLLPALTELIPEFERLAPDVAKASVMFARFVGELARNPWGTLFKIMAAKLVADIAVAGIGKALSAAAVGVVQRAAAAMGFGGAGRSGGGPGAAPAMYGVNAAQTAKPGFLGRPTMAGAGRAAGMGAAIGLTVATMIVTAGVANFEAGEANMAAGGSELNRMREAAKLGDVETARSTYQKLQEQERQVMAPGFLESLPFFGKTVANWVDPNKETERRTVSSYVDEARQRLAEAEANRAKQLEQAANKQDMAGDKLSGVADKLSGVADKLGGVGLNRGDNPSGPTKG